MCRILGPIRDRLDDTQENEVLDSDETAELFVSYLNTGSEPSGFARRRIEL